MKDSAAVENHSPALSPATFTTRAASPGSRTTKATSEQE